MDARDREGLKDELRAMAAGRGDGLDLDTQDRWVVGGLEDAAGFFRHLHVLLAEPGAILYFEGTSVAPEVAAYYERHRAANAVSVTRDTIYPIPETFHVPLTPELPEELVALIDRHSVAGCFHHVKAYREERLLMTFHDAFDGSELLVADVVPESAVREFCARLGGSLRRELNENKRDPEQLRRFLWALENPDLVRLKRPWWQRILFFWRR